MHGINSPYRLLRGLYALDANNKIWTEFGLYFDKSGFEEGQLNNATLFQGQFSDISPA